MRTRNRLIAALVTTGVAVGGLSACGMLNKTLEDDATVSQKITSVRLDNGSGGVTLRGRQGDTTVNVHRSVEYSRDTAPEGKTYQVENGVLILRGCGDDCSVNYTIDLPAGLPVTGENSSGAVKLTRTGAVQVKTGSGAIDLDDVTGKVDIRAGSGAITAHGLKGGPVTAKTDSGAIDIKLSAPQDVRAQAGSGAVSLTVPDATYQVKAKTNSGGKDIAVDNDSSGKYRLDLSTGSGAISVERS
ncbi:hypothetical protein GCM10010218_27350 [Streptomyces mashuensis]|uniref:DUF4097 domain-containing protein n=1 Tax=Streptomyces mashuensis TaxID=33904 RepID=A0A919EDE8_9ACTN|nr:DUF4097 family beta strand repeat-containing protein [Streptomyces mashuensis]GHF44507.1 hypothetical protein GCM10010218_27350 [Streptomyces mashuensis]